MAAKENPNIFFAYASKPPLRVDAIRQAIGELEKRGVDAVGWESLVVSGRRLIDPILEAIRCADIVIVELSSFNPNVLFEFGYALSLGKQTYIAFDETDMSAAALWKTFPIFEQIGRVDYSGNHQILANQIVRNMSESTQSLSQSLIAGAQPREDNAVFAVHSPIKHTAAQSLERFLERQTHLTFRGSNADLILAPLEFYTKEIYRSSAAIFHLLGSNRKRSVEHNAVSSFLAGFARGLDLPIIMAVEGGQANPLDYVDLLYEYDTAAQLQSKVEAWLGSLPKTAGSKRRMGRLALDIELPLHSFGEYVAEYETESLPDYFVQTSEFNAVVGGDAKVFAGRKGTGKSATMSQAAAELALDRGILVVPIKPSSHEMSGLTQVVSDYGSGEQLEYMLTMIWKYVVQTEVALKVIAESDVSPGHLIDGEIVDDLRNLLSHMSISAESSFTDRIESVVRRLEKVHGGQGLTLTPQDVAKALRTDGLTRLVQLTKAALREKTRIAVLVDNLDKNWEPSDQLESLSRLILALLVASGKIEKDFEHRGGSAQEFECSVSLFIRTDILEAVKKYAREPDKIGSRTVDWNDEQLLVRVLEERYQVNSRQSGGTMWAELFCDEVQGLPTRDYLLWRVLRRPRDFIYMANAALTTAINRKHDRIDASDILYAEKEYSRFAIEALLVESSSAFDELEEMLFEFAGVGATMSEQDLDDILKSEQNGDQVKWWLMSTSFLGVETSGGKFDYVEGLDVSRRKLRVAQRNSSNNDRVLRFQVHPAFRAYLEIVDDDLHS